MPTHPHLLLDEATNEEIEASMPARPRAPPKPSAKSKAKAAAKTKVAPPDQPAKAEPVGDSTSIVPAATTKPPAKRLLSKTPDAPAKSPGEIAVLTEAGCGLVELAW